MAYRLGQSESRFTIVKIKKRKDFKALNTGQRSVSRETEAIAIYRPAARDEECAEEVALQKLCTERFLAAHAEWILAPIWVEYAQDGPRESAWGQSQNISIGFGRSSTNGRLVLQAPGRAVFERKDRVNRMRAGLRASRKSAVVREAGH